MPGEPVGQSPRPASTRTASGGKVLTPPRARTVNEAMKVVTVDAVYIPGLERDAGGIQSGKLVEFAVLEAAPPPYRGSEQEQGHQCLRRGVRGQASAVSIDVDPVPLDKGRAGDLPEKRGLRR
jgi:hypothetical protein